MDRKVAVAAIVSSIASGAVAIAVSYRLWGAEVAELRDRQDVVMGDLVLLDQRMKKNDESMLRLIDAFKLAEEKFQAARAAKFWCATGGSIFGYCARAEDACKTWRVTASKLNPSACVKQEHAFCVVSTNGGGGDAQEDCFPSEEACKTVAVEMGKQSGRLFRSCEIR